MAKRPTQKTVASGFSSASMLNYNVTEMLGAFDNTLSLDGSAPNAMTADFDLNSNDILNAGDIAAVNVVITGTLSGAAIVGLTATNNLSDVASASAAATNLGLGTGDSPQFAAVNVGAEIVTAAKINKLDAIEALADVTDTTNVTAAGALMDSEVTNLAQVKAFDTSAYATSAQGTLAANALPKAGGALTGAVTTNSTFDGRDVATDGTKLDTIETSADVTDTANVTAAGALMDSEVDADIKTLLLPASTTISTFGASLVDDANAAAALTTLGAQPLAAVLTNTTASFLTADETKLDGIEALADVTDATNVTASGALMDSEVSNLAEVKAFASADYATAAQGTLAANALPKSGGAMTGAITTNSTFDGRDVATDGTKLDTIETSADVTDTTNVTAAGALMDSEVDADIKTLVLPASTTISTFGASLVDDATAAAAATTLGLGTGDSPTFTSVTVTGGTVLLNGSELSGIKVTIADDAVATLTFPTRQGGFLFITANAQGVYPRIADMGVSVPVDFGASPGYSTPMWLGSAMEMNNAAALNGTTGTDGKVTVGTAGVTGTLYIENRMGSSFPFFITLL